MEILPTTVYSVNERKPLAEGERVEFRVLDVNGDVSYSNGFTVPAGNTADALIGIEATLS